jgi:hypothetical protein
MEERRRSPRRDVNELAILPTSTNVRVLDISTGGVMLGMSRSVELGTRGRLRLNLEGEPFAADVQIQRVSAGPADGYLVGAMFLELDAPSRQLIERFMTR